MMIRSRLVVVMVVVVVHEPSYVYSMKPVGGRYGSSLHKICVAYRIKRVEGIQRRKNRPDVFVFELVVVMEK